MPVQSNVIHGSDYFLKNRIFLTIFFIFRISGKIHLGSKYIRKDNESLFLLSDNDRIASLGQFSFFEAI